MDIFIGRVGVKILSELRQPTRERENFNFSDERFLGIWNLIRIILEQTRTTENIYRIKIKSMN